MHAVHIRNWPTPVQLRRGTILDAALSGGVPVPYQCRSGECGSCKCRLLKGRVDHDEYLPEALSEHERSDGWVLACRARPKTDVEIDYDGKLELQAPSPQRRTARVESRDRLTDDTVRLVLALDGDPLPFLAGQFVYLRFGRLPPRSYSMASLSGHRSLEFFVREVAGGTVSAHIARYLAVGDRVGVEGPFGQAYLRKSKPTMIVAAAGGSGLAPILAIAREAVWSDLPCPVHLYFGVRSESDLFGLAALTELAERSSRLSIHVVLSVLPAAPTEFRVGFPHDAIAADFTDLSTARVYSAGPPPMVAAVTRTALGLGAQVENIHSDPFTNDQTVVERPITRLIARGLDMMGRRSIGR